MTTPPFSCFPFAALVGLDNLKLALQLAAIDRRLSVVVRGDKGAGKTTAARGLAALLDTHAPFVTLPIGATEDRLLGGLDVEKALRGEPVLKRGLLAEANGGVLYVDEVNLLPDHLADTLLDAVASGVHILERDGLSASQPADFVLLGSMNPEEGALRPQLLDRFALAADVQAPTDIELRCQVLERRLAFDRDPEAFVGAWAEAQLSVAGKLASARARLTSVLLHREVLQYVATRVAEHDVRSLRADLAVVRASRAHAALDGSDAVSEAHVDAVLPVALAHRTPATRRPPTQPSSLERPTEPSRRGEESSSRDSALERVFEAASIEAPRLTLDHSGGRAGKTSGESGPPVGPVVTTRRSEKPGELDVRQSLLHAVTHTGAARLTAEDLYERVRAPSVSTRFIFIVDSSGSHAVYERMALVKGAVSGLLAASHGRHDEVVVIACRGAESQVLVEPTSSREDADRALEYLPTGGRTPLAHAFELAARYVTDHAVAVLITDGHANVPLRTADAWSDALVAAAALNCTALVIDTEEARRSTGNPQKLAAAMRATCVRLAELDQAHAVRLIREIA
jgi:magnesium chelatase subunit D